MPSWNIVTSYGKRQYRQYRKISYEIFPDKNHTTRIMDCMRLRFTIQVPYHARSRLPTQQTSCQDLNFPQKKVELKLREDILTSPIEVNLQSTDVAVEEQLFFLPDEEEESVDEIFATGKHYNVLLTNMKKKLSTKATEVSKTPLNPTTSNTTNTVQHPGHQTGT